MPLIIDDPTDGDDMSDPTTPPFGEPLSDHWRTEHLRRGDALLAGVLGDLEDPKVPPQLVAIVVAAAHAHYAAAGAVRGTTLVGVRPASDAATTIEGTTP